MFPFDDVIMLSVPLAVLKGDIYQMYSYLYYLGKYLFDDRCIPLVTGN